MRRERRASKKKKTNASNRQCHPSRSSNPGLRLHSALRRPLEPGECTGRVGKAPGFDLLWNGSWSVESFWTVCVLCAFPQFNALQLNLWEITKHPHNVSGGGRGELDFEDLHITTCAGGVKVNRVCHLSSPRVCGSGSVTWYKTKYGNWYLALLSAIFSVRKLFLCFSNLLLSTGIFFRCYRLYSDSARNLGVF